ncbi:PREDICTED: transferrin [Nicrophorus vespilloides]|uniref:Transferrin n=1 Tax=Nicrophorus vespilloides TaxID=110193 RepID=A0ABM1N725_NICVS|nr:PREDICTED: transferrin [Nicrophorus vespilloides]
MKIFLFLALAICAANARLVRRSANAEFKMCVPEIMMDDCKEMIQQKTKATAKIVCIPARDRIECIEKIKEHVADFGMVDPEDMYVAAKLPDSDFQVFEEIRTIEEPEAEFRYEGVAVVHKDLEINSVQGLKGLRSCHTGVGRNVGYKIPLTKLKNMGIIGNLAEPTLSPRENELEAFSKLFSKACIVGKWSPDADIDSKMKKRFSNLCELCEHPDKCDYPDNFSGYDGALRCLAHNNGQIAWTKVIYVRKFFGLPVGITPGQPSAENPDNFAYFCPDGSKVPITGTPCRWAARPWQGYMANAAVVKNIDELRRKIENLNDEGSKSHAEWLEKVLEISDKNVPKETKLIEAQNYLDKANYTDVIEREYGPPYKTIRFCVSSNDGLEKCKGLSKAAFSRNIRPRYECVLETNCMEAIHKKRADIVTIPADQLSVALSKYELKPIIEENYGADVYAVAVVKKDSAIKSFAELKGKKSCHTGDKMAGFYAVVNILKRLDLLTKPEDCSAGNALAEFFGQGCLAKSQGELVLNAKAKESLCGLCEDKEACSMGDNTCSRALQCLDSEGDVAFVKSSVFSHISPEQKANYELLCPNGKRAPLTDASTCNLLLKPLPPSMVVTTKEKTTQEIEEIESCVLSTSQLFLKRPDYFRLFGEFNGKMNLLFSRTVKSLKSIHDFDENTIKKTLSVVQDYCH